MNDLNKEQREQLNDIMRKAQMKQVKDSSITQDDDEDVDTFVAKKVMAFAAVPSQNIIGMQAKEKKQKPKFKLLKKRKRNLKNDEDDRNKEEKQPASKKRKIYQQMTKKQLNRQRRKKLKFKSDANCENKPSANVKQKNSSMLSFDPDEE